jgi:hypothetical protein
MSAIPTIAKIERNRGIPLATRPAMAKKSTNGPLRIAK